MSARMKNANIKLAGSGTPRKKRVIILTNILN
jgi:hypothetical protein